MNAAELPYPNILNLEIQLSFSLLGAERHSSMKQCLPWVNSDSLNSLIQGSHRSMSVLVWCFGDHYPQQERIVSPQVNRASWMVAGMNTS